jgi:hypothetical protein
MPAAGAVTGSSSSILLRRRRCHRRRRPGPAAGAQAVTVTVIGSSWSILVRRARLDVEDDSVVRERSQELHPVAVTQNAASVGTGSAERRRPASLFRARMPGRAKFQQLKTNTRYPRKAAISKNCFCMEYGPNVQM